MVFLNKNSRVVFVVFFVCSSDWQLLLMLLLFIALYLVFVIKVITYVKFCCCCSVQFVVRWWYLRYVVCYRIYPVIYIPVTQGSKEKTANTIEP